MTVHATAIRIHCDCGRWVQTDPETDRATCACGRVFVVTATELRPDVGRTTPE